MKSKRPSRWWMATAPPTASNTFCSTTPPILNPELGIRRRVLQESVYLTGDLLAYDVQTLIFARSRHAVELTLRYLRDSASPAVPPSREREATPSPQGGEDQGEGGIRAYRSGYLLQERREVEHELRTGEVQVVAATNALELGIDIGGMDAVVLAGYPGTITATLQQAGRAGRGTAVSLAVLLTSANPLDQFLAHNPDYFFERSPEHALINPDNLLILLEHLRCAAFELPFLTGEEFGDVDPETVAEFLSFVTEAGQVHPSNVAKDHPVHDLEDSLLVVNAPFGFSANPVYSGFFQM